MLQKAKVSQGMHQKVSIIKYCWGEGIPREKGGGYEKEVLDAYYCTNCSATCQ
jgi:hypothetical protein